MSKILILLLLLAAVVTLPGCSFLANRSFGARGISHVEAAQLATSIASYLAGTNPAAQTTIAVEIPKFARLRDPLAPALADGLRQAGFAVIETDTGIPLPARTRLLSYEVAAWSDGVSIRLQLDSSLISRWYTRAPGGVLTAAAPFSIREVSYVGQ
ncbi:hypothetical protein VDS42_19185 [Xanthomonas campestris pv. campestris]|nr:hypothetical protein [Xanthomonas campestris pv. campestris]